MKYKRVLLKLSWKSLAGGMEKGIDIAELYIKNRADRHLTKENVVV